MTVEITTTSSVHAGNGVTTALPTGFRFLDDNDLVVTQTIAGVTTTLVKGTHYNVDGAGDDEPGGTVNMLVAPANGTTITIERVTPVTQETEFGAFTRFNPEDHELALDKLTMVAQENRNRIEALESLGAIVTITNITGVRTDKDFATNAASVEATFPFNVVVANGSTATDCVLTRLQNLDDPTEVFDELPGVQWAPGVGNNVSIKRIGGLKPNTNYRARFLTFFP